MRRLLHRHRKFLTSTVLGLGMFALFVAGRRHGALGDPRKRHAAVSADSSGAAAAAHTPTQEERLRDYAAITDL